MIGIIIVAAFLIGYFIHLEIKWNKHKKTSVTTTTTKKVDSCPNITSVKYVYKRD